MSYRVKISTIYWTATGNNAGNIPAGTILDLDRTSKTIREQNMYKIILPLVYQNKYVPLTNLEFVDPEPEPTIHRTHFIEVFSDGSIYIDGILHA